MQQADHGEISLFSSVQAELESHLGEEARYYEMK